jgi:lactose/L-arabinose transport system substrate-binding protein
MQEAEKVYQKTNPDFKLNIVETPWDDVQTKLTTAVTSGELKTLPDIFLMQDNAFQKNYTNFPDAFTDITASGIAFDSFAQAKVAYSVVDGKNFGVPFDNGTCINALRTDVLEQAGYTVADFTDITWDKFIELGKDVLAKTKMPLLSAQAGSPDLVMEILQSCGQSLFKEDGTPNIVGNEALLAAINVYTTLVKEGILVEVNDWDQYIGTLTNGTVAGTINGCWILASIQSATDQSGKWAVTNIPSLNNIPNATNFSNNGGSSWTVTSNCKNKELAYDFFSKTFAGSVEFYETILPSSGALATYLPVGDSPVYAKTSDFFGGQAIYADITAFAGKVPSNITGVYYYEARDAVGTAMTNVVGGADLVSELKNAEDTVKFQMGK